VRRGRVCGRKGRKGRALRVGVRLGRVYRRKGRALQVGVKLGRELRAKVRVVRGLQGLVRLGKACKRAKRARKSPGRARKSNTIPLVIEKSLLRTLASFLYIIYTENKIRK
jgi:hypothetical protein